MRVFFDTNILLDIALRRPNFVDESLKAVERCQKQGGECWISWHTIANLSYLIEREVDANQSKEFLKNLLDVFTVASVGHEDATLAFTYDAGDFEDALQIVSAIACHANIIVTRDSKGYSKSPIKVTHPKFFNCKRGSKHL